MTSSSYCPSSTLFFKNADKESRDFIVQLEQTCEELKQTVATLREKNIKLKAELSTAEQEIKIRNTVEREHRASLYLLHSVRCLTNVPD